MILLAMASLIISSGHLDAAQVLFTPELTLSEEYTDNIYLAPENEEEDYITTAGVNLTMQVLGRTSGLELNFNPSYSALANNSDLDYWRYAGRLRLWNDMTRGTRLELTTDYLETEDPRDASNDFSPDDPLEGPAIDTDLNRRGRNRYRTIVSEGRLSNQFGARDRLYLALRYSQLEDIDTFPGQDVSDYANWQPSAGVEYWFVQRWGFALDGYFSDRDYVDENDRQEYSANGRLLFALRQSLTGFAGYRYTALDYDEETDDDYQIHEPSIGLTYQFEENARITIGVGYYIQEFDNSDDTEEGWTVNSEIYKRWNFRSSDLSLTGMSGYAIEDTGTEDLGLNIYYQGGLEANHRFTPRLSAGVYGTYRLDEFPNEDPERTDKTLAAGTRLSYQALQWMFITLAYNYTDVTSDSQIQEYTENSVVLTLSLRPAAPYRLN